ncbi:hypothetical protein HPT25_18955 [Bacillus sp. BRMEA1]|uniref:hypothetical protein n=1 Tax=Neobacillus endophyticus TaxID=2738405 RepID=UPI001565D6E5|nr:hypothetical protein [Neobacillus endophyticus]NRD79445.1 hypothetical protein [Neobacillus endophyticus]
MVISTDSVITSLGKLLVVVLLFLALIVAELFGLNAAATAINNAILATVRDP